MNPSESNCSPPPAWTSAQGGSALILAAGLGTRLKPLTDTMPKALVPLRGKPLLAHQLERLKAAGFAHVVVNVHHFAEQIIRYLDTHDFGLDIRISDERQQLLDTGGAIKQAAMLLPPDVPLLVHNVDIFHHIDLRAFYQSHNPLDEATLLTTDRRTTRYLVGCPDGCLLAWTNTATGDVKPQGMDINGLPLHAFSGIHIVSPAAISAMATWPAKFSVIDFYLSRAPHAHIRLKMHPNAPLIDVGKQATLAEAERFVGGGG